MNRVEDWFIRRLERKLWLERRVRRLRKSDATMFLLRNLFGCTYQEIAIGMLISERTVSRHHAAIMEEMYEEADGDLFEGKS